VGVLTALKDILPSSAHNPFPIICGTSAGAINALSLATHTGSFVEAALDLQTIWRNIAIEKIFKTSWFDLSKGAGRLTASLFNQGVGKDHPVALLDNAPLREFLLETINFDNIETGIEAGDLHAVCVTAMGYTSGETVTRCAQLAPLSARWLANEANRGSLARIVGHTHRVSHR